MNIERRCLDNNKIRLCLKTTASVLILFFIMYAFFIDGIKPYYTVKNYSYQNDFTSDQIAVLQGKQAAQHFIARGNIITNLELFINDVESQVISVALLDLNNKTIREEEVYLSSFNVGSWNRIEFDCDVKRGSEYVLQFYSEKGLSSLILDYGDRPETYISFQNEGKDIGAGLAVGVQQTYVYITWAGFFELTFIFVVLVILALGLCYAIFNAEKLIYAWNFDHSKISVVYAIYFAVSLVLVFNPIDAIRTSVESFGRIMGAGFIANVDTSRRISNFNLWYIFFVVALVLFYALTNYCRQKELREQQKRVLKVLDQVIVLANVNLLLRCITYFEDKTNMQTVFYYSTAVLMLVVLAGIGYIAFDFDKKISSTGFAKVILMSFCLGYPIAIISQHEWQAGKLLFGYQQIILIVALLLVYLLKDKMKCGERELTIGVNVFALIPFITSFFIEFINILNQHEVYIYHLRRYYSIIIFTVVLIAGIIVIVVNRKNIKIEKWKKWTYSWLIFGIACFQQQIPLENTYNADIFESANASILISDFLNFGDIPIIQHYGGHMMKSVWEGLLYTIINNDFAGAIFSPYSGYITPVLAVLFFLLIRKLLDDETAFLTTLFFPFMGEWSYYGLGMIVCVAVWSYLKKNTYWRAALIWLAFIWTTIYRLDLGGSIGVACMAAMTIYIVTCKNWKAIKHLILTLLLWGIFGGVLWCVLCVIRHVNPANRLIEFLMISLSNQNWAYSGIGNTGNTLFAWCYIVVPFVIAGSLCYVVLSKRFREETTLEMWIALLILGFSYFTNFSRGLVRHSLAETATTIVLWDAFIYLALFIASYKRRKELFLPSLIVLIMSSTALTTTANYNISIIGDYAASRIGDFTQGWTLDRFAYEDLPKNSVGIVEEPKTYWTKLAENEEKVNRTEWAEELKWTIKPYEIVIDELLEEDETFVDFINKTFVYSAINRQNPVYVSQSPMQLSGEFAQEMFVEEMENVPLVLMPVNDDRAANSLDGVVNSYRYYKVAEYIYQNYVPLCRYGNTYAVWCLFDRYDEFKLKASNLLGGNDYVDALYKSNQVRPSSCEKRIDESTGESYIVFAGVDSIVDDMNNFIDLSAYYNGLVKISVEYNTDIEGEMQIFYTTAMGENYTEDKVSTVHIVGDGIADFIVPVTEYTRLKMNIPEGSTVAIRSLKVSSPVTYIEYGYDNSTQNIDESGNNWNTYDNGFHIYNLAYLPSIWADNDRAIINTEYAELQQANGYYLFDRSAISSKEHGNYLLFRATYNGTDTRRSYDNDDEVIGASIKVGIYENGIFSEKYQYNVTLKEGTNDYLIRVSNDYYWYCGDVNAVKVICDGILYDVDMKVLEGD